MSQLIHRMRYVVSRLRYQIRKRRAVSFLIYMTGNVYHALLPPCDDAGNSSLAPATVPTRRLAICLRFRDEAIYLKEWLDYYIAAGVDHFFLYNNYSQDNYADILAPYVDSALVTLIDWPRTPASPDAENDCIARTRGHFKWVGFLDADEFVVIRDGQSIVDLLAEFDDAPGVALHWYYYGSNGHRTRPTGLVINSYQQRAREPNIHFKVFVRPDCVTSNRNSHNFYFRHARCAVNENHTRVYGSLTVPGTATRAWINHYYVKSLEDYIAKARRASTLDISGIREPNRRIADAEDALTRDNDVFDPCAATYYQRRSLAMIAGRREGA